MGSLLAVIYMWKLVETAYFNRVDASELVVREAPLQLLVPTWILIGASLYFGINTELTIGAAGNAAEWLLGAGASPLEEEDVARTHSFAESTLRHAWLIHEDDGS